MSRPSYMWLNRAIFHFLLPFINFGILSSPAWLVQLAFHRHLVDSSLANSLRKRTAKDDEARLIDMVVRRCSFPAYLTGVYTSIRMQLPETDWVVDGGGFSMAGL